MKTKNTSPTTGFFSPEFIAAAIAAAPEHVEYDEENPPWTDEQWKNAIISHSYAELKEKLAERRRHRGAQKAPKKKATTLRLDVEVMDGMRALGKGWQTRINEVLRDWLKAQQRNAV